MQRIQGRERAAHLFAQTSVFSLITKLSLWAFLALGALASMTCEIVFPPQGESVPQNVRLQAGNTEVLLFWSRPPGVPQSKVYGYNVYRDEEYLQTKGSLSTVRATASNFLDRNLSNNKQYTYKISIVYNADDAADSENGALIGRQSTAVQAHTREVPGRPGNFTAVQVPNTGDVQISWISPAVQGASNIFEYRLYRNGATIARVSGSQYDFTDTNLQRGGARYVYTVRAINSTGIGIESSTTVIMN